MENELPPQGPQFRTTQMSNLITDMYDSEYMNLEAEFERDQWLRQQEEDES